MRQVFLRGGKGVVEEVPAPSVGDNSVLVQVAFSCVSSGTEGASLNNSSKNLVQRAIEQPENVKKVINSVQTVGLRNTVGRVKGQVQHGVASGYSAAGTIKRIGANVTNFKIGDRVACSGSGIAFHAEYIDVPCNLVSRVPKAVDLKIASTVTLGAIAMQGVRRANPSLGETFLVIGLGTIGQIIIQLLKAAGCRVIGADIHSERIVAAKSLGIDLGVDPNGKNYQQIIDNFTHGIGVDGVIIAASTQSSDVTNTAMQVSRRKGRLIVVGDVGMNLKREDLYHKELDFLISTSYGPGRYDPLYEEKGIDYPIGYVRWTENRNMGEYLRLVEDGKVAFLEDDIQTYGVEQAESALANLTVKGNRPSLVFLKYKVEHSTPIHKVELKPSFRMPNKPAKPSLGVVGASSFFEGVHLGNLKRLSPSVPIVAVQSRTGHRAKAIATRLGANYCTTEYSDLLNDSQINTIFICTRHNLHTTLLVQALKADKNVFVEKPLALNLEELDQLKSFYQTRPAGDQPIFMVGYNRRFSPIMQKLKLEIVNRTTPIQVNYVMNAGSLPLGHWVNDEEGGGRNIGEACHIYDLFNFLVGSEVNVLTVKAQSLDAGSRFLRSENFVASISYEDGSLCNLVYSATGGPSFPKESMTLFVDGQTYLMKNFIDLQHFGSGRYIWKSKTAQKGHLQELENFFKGLRKGSQWPISYEDQIKASEISFLVEQQVT